MALDLINVMFKVAFCSVSVEQMGDLYFHYSVISEVSFHERAD